MSMKKYLSGFGVVASLLMVSADGDAALIAQESFETTSGYTFTQSQFYDGSSDYFDRFNYNTTDNPGFIDPWTGFAYGAPDGNYFIAGEDIDDGGNPDATSLGLVTLDAIVITGLTSLSVTLAAAQGAVDRIDASGDELYVEASIDGSSFVKVMAFKNDGSTFNTNFQEDTNLDGTGDGTTLTGSFQDFSAVIVGTGDSLVLRVGLSLNSGDEQAAFDNVRVFAVPEPASLVLIGLGSLVMLGRCRRIS